MQTHSANTRPALDHFHWEKSFLGEWAEYPGHPVILACMIMDRYPDLASACAKEPGADYANALRDPFIPGSGCAVHAALNTLRLTQEQGIDAAYAYAEHYWHGWEQQHPNNAPKAEHGREQCARIKPHFEAYLETWGTPDAPPSPYRV